MTTDIALPLQINVSYEFALLGALINGSPMPEIEPDDLYSPKLVELLTLVIRARAEKVPAGPVAFAGWLADQGQLARFGGGAFIHDLIAQAAADSSLSWYAQQLRELADRRKYATVAAQVSQAAARPGISSETLAGIVSNLARGVRQRAVGGGLEGIGAYAGIGQAEIEMASSKPVGVKTGFLDLDALLPGGLRGGQMISVCGRPGSGKSTLALDIARYCAHRGLVVAFFCMEMSRQEMFERYMSAESGVPHEVIRSGSLGSDDWRNFAAHLPSVDFPLYFADARRPLVRVEANLRQLADKVGRIDLVVIDQLQHVTPASAGRRAQSRQEEVGAIAVGIKGLAMELSVPVIPCVQMNRDKEKGHRPPQLSDIRESGEIENVSDGVLMVDRPDQLDPESERAGEADIWIRKNRSGPEGVVTLAAQLHRCRFRDIIAQPALDQSGTGWLAGGRY